MSRRQGQGDLTAALPQTPHPLPPSGRRCCPGAPRRCPGRWTARCQTLRWRRHLLVHAGQGHQRIDQRRQFFGLRLCLVDPFLLSGLHFQQAQAGGDVRTATPPAQMPRAPWSSARTVHRWCSAAAAPWTSPLPAKPEARLDWAECSRVQPGLCAQFPNIRSTLVFPPGGV